MPFFLNPGLFYMLHPKIYYSPFIITIFCYFVSRTPLSINKASVTKICNKCGRFLYSSSRLQISLGTAGDATNRNPPYRSHHHHHPHHLLESPSFLSSPMCVLAALIELSSIYRVYIIVKQEFPFISRNNIHSFPRKQNNIIVV